MPRDPGFIDSNEEQGLPSQRYPVDSHDFKGDVLKPQAVLDHLKAHDDRMRSQAPDWAMAKAMYTTRYWQYIRGNSSSASTTSGALDNHVDVEVNRLFPYISSYMSSLYPRAQRTIMTHDPMSSADPEKAALVANRWLSTQKVHQRVMSGIKQALIYPGCGAKLGFSPGAGNALDRVWLRIIPWWEIVLDFDVSDPEDERFRGHVFFQSRQKIEKEYGLTGLVGTRREDFLDRLEYGSDGKTTKSAAARASGRSAKATADQQAFVRVLEIINLVDTIADDEDPSIEYQGRLEIYVLGQPGEISKRPIYMGPLPFAKFDKTPLQHILPLIFSHEPEYPLRGMAHSARFLPQMQELNAYRAFMAMATRKDSRQYLTRKGTLEADELTKISEGVEGYIAQVSADFTRDLTDALVPVPQAALNVTIDRYMNYVEIDLDRTMRQSPQARGEITKATAFEIQTVQQYTESEFGMHAALKDQWLAEIVRVFLRALIAAMQTTGDYAGAFLKQNVELASVGAKPEAMDTGSTEDVQIDAEQKKAVVLSELQSFQAPFIDEQAVEPLGVHQVSEEETAIVQETLKLVDNRGEPIEVGVPDIDAEFDISFVEGGRTPLTDAAMQQNLVALLKPYNDLWMAAQQGGPQGALAKTYMQVIAERFDLPKDLYPAELDARAASMPQQQQAAPVPEPGRPPQAGSPQQQGGIPPEVQETLSQVLELPPGDAIRILRKLFANDPKMQELLGQMEQLPPDKQAVMIEQMVQGVLGAGQPTNGVPQEEMA
jgi:hypothetical protein